VARECEKAESLWLFGDFLFDFLAIGGGYIAKVEV
jgi:hypothetical protein